MKTREEVDEYVGKIIDDLRRVNDKYAKIYNLDTKKLREAEQIIRRTLFKYLVENMN